MVAPPATRWLSNGTMPANPSGPCSTPARICSAAAWRLADTVPLAADDDVDEDDEDASGGTGMVAADGAGSSAPDEPPCSCGSSGCAADDVDGGKNAANGADGGIKGCGSGKDGGYAASACWSIMVLPA